MTATATTAIPPEPVRLRPASPEDLPQLLPMLEAAKERLRALGLTQWQSGYPDGETRREDIAIGRGFLLARGEIALTYAAICFGEDESYRSIEGAWLREGPYAAVHRLMTAQPALRGGYALRLLREAEALAVSRGAGSLRADTHRGNLPMRALLARAGFTACGVIRLVHTPEPDPERLAFQKLLEERTSVP